MSSSRAIFAFRGENSTLRSLFSGSLIHKVSLSPLPARSILRASFDPNVAQRPLTSFFLPTWRTPAHSIFVSRANLFHIRKIEVTSFFRRGNMRTWFPGVVSVVGVLLFLFATHGHAAIGDWTYWGQSGLTNRSSAVYWEDYSKGDLYVLGGALNLFFAFVAPLRSRHLATFQSQFLRSIYHIIDEFGATDFYRISLNATAPVVTWIATYLGAPVYPAEENTMSPTINPGGRWGSVGIVDTVSSYGDTLLCATIILLCFFFILFYFFFFYFFFFFTRFSYSFLFSDGSLEEFALRGVSCLTFGTTL
jgi:hypothetical protein